MDLLTVTDSAVSFLASLSPEEAQASQQEVFRFVRWYGGERPFGRIAPAEVAGYVDWLSSSDTDYQERLEAVRAFLTYAKKKGWSKTNLATHLKARKGKNAPLPGRSCMAEPIILSQQKQEELQAEIATLKGKRVQVIEEMHRAAADKDFRENAPLHAAREQYGHIEGRLGELEATLKSATVLNGSAVGAKAAIGDSVVLCDLASGEEVSYRLVSPNETDPLKGKISVASPLGKAVTGRSEGETVEIKVPAGKLRYQVKRIERT